MLGHSVCAPAFVVAVLTPLRSVGVKEEIGCAVEGLLLARRSSPAFIALAAVIEDENGRLSYWGLRHPPGKPDFHHPNGFALEVARP